MILSNLANVLRDAGLTVVEVDGWKTRGYLGRDLADVTAVIWHHTASNRNRFNGDDAPSLGICTHGRSDVAGPLCQIVLGRSGTVYITAAGLSNHAGAGSSPGIPTDMANYYAIGIEMESSGVAPFDWTEDQLRVAPYLGAALERAYLFDQPEAERIQIAHKEWSSQGKIDPAGWPGDIDGLRDSINAVLRGSLPAAVTPQDYTVPAAPSRPGGYEECVVEPSDSLSRIAAQFHVGLAELLGVNPQITDPNVIGIGDVLNLPAGAWEDQPPAPAAQQIIRGEDEIHWVVESGDTLSKIAAYYNGPTVAQIAAHNNIDPDRITPGQKIWIPGPLVWIIEAPDTIRSIAAYYGLDAGHLARLNGLPGPDATIFIGNRLTIKEG